MCSGSGAGAGESFLHGVGHGLAREFREAGEGVSDSLQVPPAFDTDSEVRLEAKMERSRESAVEVFGQSHFDPFAAEGSGHPYSGTGCEVGAATR